MKNNEKQSFWYKFSAYEISRGVKESNRKEFFRQHMNVEYDVKKIKKKNFKLFLPLNYMSTDIFCDSLGYKGHLHFT